jgi:hypothetical protein
MEITMFSVLTIEVKDSFHMPFFRLTNEAFFDTKMPGICKLRGGDGWRKTFNSFPLDLEFSFYKLFLSEI